MDEDAIRKVLSQNMATLMGQKGVVARAKDMGIGTGTLQRAEGGTGQIKIDTIAKIAAHFDIEPYRLLMPNLGEEIVKRETAVWPFEQVVTLSRYERLTDRQKGSVEEALRAAVERCENQQADQHGDPPKVVNN